MLDRRAFLIATTSASVCATVPVRADVVARRHLKLQTTPALLLRAETVARRVERLTAERIRIVVGVPSTHSPLDPFHLSRDITFDTLHALTDVHPGFAFFAGLPGALGMPLDDLKRWIATDGQSVWQALQSDVRLTCLIAGTTRHGSDLWTTQRVTTATALSQTSMACAGATASVMRGLGANAVLNRDTPPGSASLDPSGMLRSCARNALSRFDGPVALSMRNATWASLPADVQAAFLAAANSEQQKLGTFRMSAQPKLYAFSAHMQSAVNRVAEAIVADIAHKDPLTRRINDGYFSARRKLRTPYAHCSAMQTLSSNCSNAIAIRT